VIIGYNIYTSGSDEGNGGEAGIFPLSDRELIWRLPHNFGKRGGIKVASRSHFQRLLSLIRIVWEDKLKKKKKRRRTAAVKEIRKRSGFKENLVVGVAEERGPWHGNPACPTFHQ
jgi:hypothetical protein